MKTSQTYLIIVLYVFELLLIVTTGCNQREDPAAPQGTPNNVPTYSLLKSGTNCVFPPSGLISWWPGDGNADDIIGGNNGTLMNGATFAPGIVAQAFSFDGVDDIVSVGTTGFPTGASARTAAMWVKLDPSDDASVSFGYGSEAWGQGFAIFPSYYSGNLFFSAFGSSYDLFTTNDIRDNQRHHIAATYDGNIIILYLDGLAVASRSIALNTGTAGGACIGARCVPHTFLTGSVDEVAIWNRALSASEIQSMFNAGSKGMCKYITICHKPGTPAQKTLVIPIQALAGHMGHGDTIGPCE
jgi:hypothetical protein